MIVAQDKLRFDREMQEWRDTLAFQEQQLERFGHINHPFLQLEPAQSMTVLDDPESPDDTPSARQRRRASQQRRQQSQQMRQQRQQRQQQHQQQASTSRSVAVSAFPNTAAGNSPDPGDSPLLNSFWNPEPNATAAIATAHPPQVVTFNNNTSSRPTSTLSMGFPLPRVGMGSSNNNNNKNPNTPNAFTMMQQQQQQLKPPPQQHHANNTMGPNMTAVTPSPPPPAQEMAFPWAAQFQQQSQQQQQQEQQQLLQQQNIMAQLLANMPPGISLEQMLEPSPLAPSTPPPQQQQQQERTSPQQFFPAALATVLESTHMQSCRQAFFCLGVLLVFLILTRNLYCEIWVLVIFLSSCLLRMAA